MVTFMGKTCGAEKRDPDRAHECTTSLGETCQGFARSNEFEQRYFAVDEHVLYNPPMHTVWAPTFASEKCVFPIKDVKDM